MNRHLSADEISGWTLGERAPESERHIVECPSCRAQVEHLNLALAEFRGGLRECSDRYAASAPRLAWSTGSRRHMARWILAAATLIVMVGGSGYWHSRTQKRAAETARADALLLEQIDSGISRPVPGSMEPLISLVSWRSNPAGENTKKENQ